MPTIAEILKFKGNPFEHYTAENEPHISEYAVRPPYLQTIVQRALAHTTFILFGDRGAGKSATRITLFNEIWGATHPHKRPLAVNLIDFTNVTSSLRKGDLTENELIREVAYLVIEQVLSWLSSLTEEDRALYTDGMTPDEEDLTIALLKAFYLPRPDMDRERSANDALRLLNRAWKTKSTLWVSQRWSALSGIIAAVVDILAKKAGAEARAPVEALLATLTGQSGATSRTVLQKLVEFVKIFPFTGIVVLVDKVDETEVTAQSSDASSRLIHPILAHVQLLEVEGFAWMFFLWTQIKPYLEGEKYPVRLDKVGHAAIEWDDKFFNDMLDARIKYFSGGQLEFDDLFDSGADVDRATSSIIGISMRSPREMVRIMDTIITEHDIVHAAKGGVQLLTMESVEDGLDKYVKDRINGIYNEKTLGQIYRLRETRFTNKEVQSAFRVGAQSARAKIQKWEEAGIVKFSGTRASDSEQGGKPFNEYSVIDARVERIIRRNLVELEDLAEAEDEVDVSTPSEATP